MPNLTPVLTVTSVDRAVTWYGEILNFEPVFVNQHDETDASAFYAVLSCETAFLHLGRDVEMEQTAGHGGFEISTDQFDAVHAAARNGGVEFYFEICLNPAGDENFAIHDPDKNRIIVTKS